MSAPEPVRVRLRYADLDTFVERFAPNVTRGGIFLASRAPRPVGEVFPFEVQLAGGEVALSGAGKVIWIKPYNAAEPNKPHGMGVQFVRVDPASRPVLDRMLRVREAAARAGTGGAPRMPSQPLVPLGAGGGGGHPPGGTNGARAHGLRAAQPAPAKPKIDTSVDLAAEFGLEESALRRAAVDGRWLAGNRDADQELEDLLRPEPAETVTLAQAVAELPRLLDPSVRRRTGTFRTLEMMGMGGAGAAPPAAVVIAPPAPADKPLNGTDAGGANGTSNGTPHDD